MSFIEVVRDPAWQAIGVLLAVAVAFIIYLLQIQRAGLALGILSSEELLTMAEELEQRVRVQFDDQLVSNIQMLSVGVKNSGNKPIQPSDFERPMTLTFSDQCKVLSAVIRKQRPSNLAAALSVSKGTISLQPLLLNPGDFLVLKILVSGKSTNFEADVRIAGVRNIDLPKRGAQLAREKGELRRGFIGILIATLTFFLVHLVNVFLGADWGPMSGWVLVVPVIIMAAFCACLWLGDRLTNRPGRYIDDA